MCLKIMEKIDKGKDKKHAGKLTSNPLAELEDKSPYISYIPFQILHRDALDMYLCNSVTEKVQNVHTYCPQLLEFRNVCEHSGWPVT